MDIEEAKKILDRIDIKFFLSGMVEQSNYVVGKADETNIAIETVLSELDKKDKIIDEMARLFSKISKGEYVTIQENTEVDKVIEYFTKKVEKNEAIN